VCGTKAGILTGGTAYRVTIPAVIQIAALRSKTANSLADEITLE